MCVGGGILQWRCTFRAALVKGITMFILLCPTSWQCIHTFAFVRAVIPDYAECVSQVSESPSECCGLSWRAFSPGVAPLMAVGLKGCVEVWQYLQAVMTWQVWKCGKLRG